MKKLHMLSFLFSFVIASISQGTLILGQNNSQVSSENHATCSQPTNVSHSINSLGKCNLIWDEMPQTSKYDISYRIKGATEWDRIGAYNNYATIRNLVPNTVYQYIVRSYCGSWDFANATAIREFNTTNTPMTKLELTGYETGITSISSKNDVLNLEFSTEVKSNIELSIRDTGGKLIYQNNINNVEGLQSETIDLSNLGGGYYMVIMHSSGKKSIEKFVIAR